MVVHSRETARLVLRQRLAFEVIGFKPFVGEEDEREWWARASGSRPGFGWLLK